MDASNFLAELVRNRPTREEKLPMTSLQAEAIAERLKEQLSIYNECHEFTPNQLITLKSGISSPYKHPVSGEPAVYIGPAPRGAFSLQDPSRNYTKDDILIAAMYRDTLAFHVVDSGFFKPFEQ